MKTSSIFLILFLFAIVANSQTTISQNTVKIRECVIVNGKLRDVEIDYNRATGEKTIVLNGITSKFSEVFPETGEGYAGGRTWFINNELVKISTSYFSKYGLPRVLGVNEISRYGEYQGAVVFVEAGTEHKTPEIIYIATRRGCEFQPYQLTFPPCNAKITISPTIGSADAGKNIVLTASSSINKPAKYSWYVGRVTSNGNSYAGDLIIDGQDAKTVTIAANVPSGTILNILVRIDYPNVDCTGEAKTIQVKVK